MVNFTTDLGGNNILIHTFSHGNLSLDIFSIERGEMVESFIDATIDGNIVPRFSFLWDKNFPDRARAIALSFVRKLTEDA